MSESNVLWVKNCIASCTNLEQLDICKVLIGLFKFKLLKDGASEQQAYMIESELLECYVAKESLLII